MEEVQMQDVKADTYERKFREKVQTCDDKYKSRPDARWSETRTVGFKLI
jgi:hypothetical protein